jgi:archaellum component FlaC
MVKKQSDDLNQQASHEKENKTTTQKEESFIDQLHDASDEAEVKVQATASHIEKNMDKYAEKISKKIEASIDPNITKKARTVGQEMEGIANSVEGLVNELGTLIPDANKQHSRSGLTIKAGFHANVSRLFIFRLLWLIIQVPIVYIWSIWATIVLIVQWLHMLFLGTRNEDLWKRLFRYGTHVTKRYAYIFWIVDEQPKIIEDLDLSK